MRPLADVICQPCNRQCLKSGLSSCKVGYHIAPPYKPGRNLPIIMQKPLEITQLCYESAIAISVHKFYTESRKIYRDRSEIKLTTKECDLFYLLVMNRGKILTYEQIYQNV